jgi:hypothetical protein
MERPLILTTLRSEGDKKKAADLLRTGTIEAE